MRVPRHHKLPSPLCPPSPRQSKLASLRPHRDPGLADAFAAVRAERRLAARAAELRHRLSDASLQQVGVDVCVLWWGGGAGRGPEAD